MAHLCPKRSSLVRTLYLQPLGKVLSGWGSPTTTARPSGRNRGCQSRSPERGGRPGRILTPNRVRKLLGVWRGGGGLDSNRPPPSLQSLTFRDTIWLATVWYSQCSVPFLLRDLLLLVEGTCVCVWIGGE